MPPLSFNDEMKMALPNPILLGDLIGYGHFGNVFHGKTYDNKDVAIKMVRDERLKKDEFLYEAHLLSQCKHENVISLKGACFHSKPYWIMVDFMENGNLRDFLKTDCKEQSIPTSRLIRIAQQVAKGMVYLTSKLRIVHRDLAARNILLDLNLLAKISDFGLSRRLPVGKQYFGPDMNLTLPLRWSAPEVVTQKIFSFKSDVWSFGIVLFEISSRGQRPFGNLSNDEILPSIILEDSHRFSMLSELPRHFPTELSSLMHNCWEKNETDRPTFSEIFVNLTTMIPNGACSNYKKYRITAPNDYRPYVKFGTRETTQKLNQNEISAWAKRLKNVAVRSPSDFAISSQIGRGHWGAVFHGETLEGEDVAIKTIRLNRVTPENFFHEAEIVAKFSHKNVINLLAICFNPLWIVTEFMENADLRTFLVEKEASAHVLPAKILIGIARQVASGMVHVSNLRIIHKDVAARNVLVGPYQNGSIPIVKVSDFGLSYQLAQNEDVYQPIDDLVAFPIRSSAPEVITDNTFSIESDVWSFGMALYEIMTQGQLPFDGLSNHMTCDYVVYRDCRTFPMLSNTKMRLCPESIRNIMTLCWNKNGKQRPTFQRISDYLVEEYGKEDSTIHECSSSYDNDTATSSVLLSTGATDL